MARTVTGYVGAGRNRRPIYRDEGPARGRAGELGGLAAIGVPAIPDKILVGAMFASGGAGQVERRQISADERAARESRDETPSLLHRAPGIPSPARQHNTLEQSRARGAARAGFTPGAVKPYLAARQAHPVTSSALEEGSVVASVTPPPTSNGHTNIPDPIPRGKAVDVVTPCEDCAHAAICRIRPLLVGLVVDARFAEAEIDPAIRIVAVSVECEYFLERIDRTPVRLTDRGHIDDSVDSDADATDEPQDARQGVTSAVAPDDAATPASEPARPSALPVPGRRITGGKLPRDTVERDALVLEAVRSTPNAELAGKKIGVSGQRIQQIVREIREAGRMPADIASLLATRRHRAPAATS